MLLVLAFFGEEMVCDEECDGMEMKRRMDGDREKKGLWNNLYQCHYAYKVDYKQIIFFFYKR